MWASVFLAEALRKCFLLLPSSSSSGFNRRPTVMCWSEALPLHTRINAPHLVLHTFHPLLLLNKRDMQNNPKQARTRVKVGAKSHTTQGQTPIHTSIPEYPIISGWLFSKLISVSLMAILILVSFKYGLCSALACGNRKHPARAGV